MLSRYEPVRPAQKPSTDSTPASTTTPRKLFSTRMADSAGTLQKADPEHAQNYARRLETYLAELSELDQAFTEVVADGNRHMVVFGDRFPLLYFCKTYGLEYRAAFHGCAGDTEPSLATLKYLIDKVQEEGIRQDFDAGATYLSLMRQNVAALKEGLA